MPLLYAVGLWLAMLGVSASTFGVAILAGRFGGGAGAFLFITLEMVLLGGAIVLWMFVGWFAARALMTLGLVASTALLIAIAGDIAGAVVAAFVAYRLVQAAYVIAGARDEFARDAANSVWLSRFWTYRPSDFRDGS